MKPSDTVLVPYMSTQAGRRFRPFLLVGLLIYSALTGVGIAILPPDLLFILAVPILIAFGAILWMLPDGRRPVPVNSIASLFVAFIVANCFWPNYLALDLPGLPWINPPRIIAFSLLTIGLYHYATSRELREEVAATLRALPLFKNAFWLFWAITLVTVGLSAQPLFSLNKWVNNQIFWTFLFVASAWICTKPGVLARLGTALVWTAILISLEAIYEYHIQQVPWMDHIPSWLKVDSEYMARVMQTQGRAGTDVYRARGTFSVSLILAEYLAIVYPFMIHAMLNARAVWQKYALFMALVATVTAMWLTNARSGMIGFFMSVFLYGTFAAVRHWRRRRHSLVGITSLAMLPIAATIFVFLAITWPRLHNMTIGGGQHQPSTEAREAQWASGWPKVFRNPIGHGVARAGETLGYANGAGVLTIDTYYLSLLLEYGFAGFALFLFMFGGQVMPGLRMFMQSADGDEESLTGPTTIALLNFLVIKSVLSSEFNIPIAFIFLGFLFAVARRRQMRELVPVVGSSPSSPALAGPQGRLAIAR